MASTTITPGVTTYRDVFAAAKFDVDGKTAADYNNGRPDYRRVQVGGLSFSGNLDDTFIVPATATEVAITLDGEEVHNFTIKHTKATEAERDETLKTINGSDSESSE